MSKHSHRQTPPKRPHHFWREIRSRALALRAPHSVVLILDWLIAKQATDLKAMKLPRIRVGYGRHSAKERAWDAQRRAKVARECGIRRLVQLPPVQRDGLAELVGLSRRQAIRVGRWLQSRGLIHIHHELGTHPVRDHYGVEHQVGRGGCLPGGVGCAAEWRAGVDVQPDEPEPEPEAPLPGPTGAESGRARYEAARERLRQRHRPERARGP